LKSIKSLNISLVIAILLTSCQTNELRIPNGEAIELNNVLSTEEWSTAKVYNIHDSLRIRMQQDSKHLYVAIDFDQVDLNEYRWVELYINDFEKSYRFHASGQLGEQYLRPPSWSENWNWGNNIKGTASTQRLADEDRKSSTNQAYEFRFEKEKFKSKELRIYLHAFSINAKASFDARPKETQFPSNLDRYQADTWLAFSL